MILEELRNDVRTYLDVDAEDLPDQLLARFAREAHRRIMSTKPRWSFLAYDWSFTTSASTAEYELDLLASGEGTYVNHIATVRRSSGMPLRQIDQGEARRRFPDDSNSGTPEFWCRVGDTLVLFPTPTSTETLYVEGWRKPVDWVGGENGYVSDFPDEFDDVIFDYVLGKAYTQQEDPDMGIQHMDLADEILRRLKAADATREGDPIVIGGQHRSSYVDIPARMRFDWE